MESLKRVTWGSAPTEEAPPASGLKVGDHVVIRGGARLLEPKAQCLTESHALDDRIVGLERSCR
jgi:hypothetical protein